MKKPTAKSRKVYDYNDLSDYIDKKYKMTIRDYHEFKFKDLIRESGCKDMYDYNFKLQYEWKQANFSDYDNYYNAKEGGTALGRTKEGYAYLLKIAEAYRQHELVAQKEIPYLDFWHFVLNYVDISNGVIRTMNFVDLKDCATEDWQKEICDLFITEFGEKDLEVEFSW